VIFLFCFHNWDFCRAALCFDKSRIFCQENLSRIPQSTLCCHAKWKVWNTHYHVPNTQKYANMVYRLHVLWFEVLWWEQGFLRSRWFFWTSLRLLVRENYLRSRRASRVYTNTWNLENTRYRVGMWLKLDIGYEYLSFCGILTFLWE